MAKEPQVAVKKEDNTSTTVKVPKESGAKADYAEIKYISNGLVISNTRLILLAD